MDASNVVLSQFAEDNGVLVLDEENFDNAVEEYGTVLAEFYAPVRAAWCARVWVCVRLVLCVY